MTTIDEGDRERLGPGQRLAGAVARAGAGALGAAPAAVVACGPERAAIGVLAGAFVAATLYFALERRDRGPARGVAITVAMTTMGLVLVPICVSAALDHDVRAPAASIAAAGRALERASGVIDREDLMRSAVLGVLLLGWPLARTRTTGLVAQATAGVLSAALALAGGQLLFRVSVDARSAAGALLAGVLVPLAVGRAEATDVVRALHAGSAGPLERDPRPVLAGWVLIALLALVAAPLLRSPGIRWHGEAVAAGTLKTISASQTLFREGDEDGNGALDYAASSLELARLVDDEVAAGLKRGLLIRVTRDPSAPEWRWAAAADPLDPRDTRRYMTNQGGVIFYTGRRGAPVPLDPSCEPPAG